MSQFENSIDIWAPSERVWAVLTTFADYPQWNPLYVGIEGRPTLGSKLSVTIARLDSKITQFSPAIIDLMPNQRLTWNGSLFMRRMIDLEQSFHLESLDAGKTRLRTIVRFRGIFVRPAWSTIEEQARAGLALMNSRIQRVAESESVSAWKAAEASRMSSDYDWKTVHQGRFYHDVLKALRIIIHAPRPVEQLALTRCKIGQDMNNKPAVSVEGGLRCGYFPERLPKETKIFYPIILGTLRGKSFVLDGAHRLVKSILSGKSSVPAIRLSPTETADCIRDGFQRKVEFEHWHV